jgi:hypothetical protein
MNREHAFYFQVYIKVVAACMGTDADRCLCRDFDDLVVTLTTSRHRANGFPFRLLSEIERCVFSLIVR